MNAETRTLYMCGKCHQHYHQKDIADTCCTDSAVAPAQPAKKCACGKELVYLYTNKCEDCHEKERFEKAEKIKDWDSWIYCEGYGYNDGYFESVEDLKEYCDDEAEHPYPEYVYATTKQEWKGLDIDNILENELEEWYEDAIENVVDYEALRIFLDEWNKKQKLVSYYVDYKKAIFLESSYTIVNIVGLTVPIQPMKIIPEA